MMKTNYLIQNFKLGSVFNQEPWAWKMSGSEHRLFLMDKCPQLSLITSFKNTEDVSFVLGENGLIHSILNN